MRHLEQEQERHGRMADKVTEVHGSRHPELAEVERVYRGLRGELEPHLTADAHEVDLGLLVRIPRPPLVVAHLERSWGNDPSRRERPFPLASGCPTGL